MAFCRYCGKPLEDKDRFCPSCGAKNEGSGTAFGGNPPADGGTPYTPQNEDGYDPRDVESTKVVCAISYIGILFFVPLLAYPDSRFAKFHANQALILLIFSVIFRVFCAVAAGIWWALPFLPNFVGNLGGGIFDLAEWAVPFAAGIFGFVNALNGKAKEIPVIGRFNLINK